LPARSRARLEKQYVVPSDGPLRVEESNALADFQAVQFRLAALADGIRAKRTSVLATPEPAPSVAVHATGMVVPVENTGMAVTPDAGAVVSTRVSDWVVKQAPREV
jgi:hypothetical protein